MLKNHDLYKRESVEIYRQLKEGEKNGKLEETFEQCFAARQMDNMNMMTIWRCREFLGKLSDEFYANNPSMLCYKIIVEAMRGNLYKTDILKAGMGETPEVLDITKVTPLDFARIMLELVLPQYDNSEFLRRARFLVTYIPNRFEGLALNACRPSVICGFRDFTEFCPGMEKNKEAIETTIEKIYGRSGKGVYDVAHAEWSYETGNAFSALVEVAGTIPALEDEKDIRCLFVAFILQMKILLMNGQTKASNDMFEKIKKKIYETGSEELEESLIAAECLHNCYEGKIDKVEKWLAEEAPNENDDLCMMDIYAYYVKMRCYLQTNQYMMTIILAKKILELLKPSVRPHDKCECHIMLAMACLSAKDEDNAFAEISKALEIGEKMGYVRVFADNGQVMVDLIKLYKSRIEEEGVDEKYLKEIRNIAVEVARRFPNYLQSGNVKDIKLTKTEKSVLELMAEGLSNEEIGIELDKKEGTIKYHTASIYKKFDVANRQQAINYAREKGIL